MYSEYAEIVGFDVGLSTQSRFDNKIIKKKHVICNRGGKQKKKSCDTLGTSGVRTKRNSNSRVIGCQAKIIFEYVCGTPDYKVFQFDELHNHPLEKRSDLKKSEPIVIFRKRVYSACFHNKNRPNYSSKVEGKSERWMMFWTDEMEKAYYVEFGDVISFNVTFRTNKYRMVFVPFTSIDHHKKRVHVEIKVEEKEINCSCEHLKCMSVLCRHALTIMMRCGVKEITERYILKRWRKDVISRNYCFSSLQSDSGDCENVKLVNDSYYNFESCFDIVRDDKKKIALFAEKQKMLLKKFESENDYTSDALKSKTDGEFVCKLMGVSIPNSKRD
uniref:SWIM-type domain-containing protein n=1 Tax=Lactuca sativa TaxID=4236 RepID=A0A9R1VFC9_LACSA|nr:hypothetical protein LSAT_V11C500233230 [Lactuca sativa]